MPCPFGTYSGYTSIDKYPTSRESWEISCEDQNLIMKNLLNLCGADGGHADNWCPPKEMKIPLGYKCPTELEEDKTGSTIKYSMKVPPNIYNFNGWDWVKCETNADNTPTILINFDSDQYATGTMSYNYVLNP